jgi:hypothetical protein
MYSAGIGIYAALKKYNVVSFNVQYSVSNFNQPYRNIFTVKSGNIVFDVDARLSYRGLNFQTTDMPFVKNRTYIPADGQYYKNYYFYRGTNSTFENDASEGGIADFYSTYNYGAMRFSGASMVTANKKTPFLNSMHSSTGKYTIIMWVRLGDRTVSNGGVLFDSGTNNGFNGIQIGEIGNASGLNLNNLSFTIKNSDTIFDLSSISNVNLGTHRVQGIALSIDCTGASNSFVRTFRGGNEYPVFNLASYFASATGSYSACPNFARIGADANGTRIVPDGTTVFSVRTYNTNLTASEVYDEFLQQAHQFDPLLILDASNSPTITNNFITDNSNYAVESLLQNTAPETAPAELFCATSIPVGSSAKSIRLRLGLMANELMSNDYTMKFVFSMPSASSTSVFYASDDGSMEIYYRTFSNEIVINHSNGTATFPVTLSANTKYMLTITYRHSYFYVHLNGVAISGTVAVNRPALRLATAAYAYIGSSPNRNSSSQINLKYVVFYPYAKFDSYDYNATLHEDDNAPFQISAPAYPVGMKRYLKLSNFIFATGTSMQLVGIELISIYGSNMEQEAGLMATELPDNYDFNILQDSMPFSKLETLYGATTYYVSKTVSTNTVLVYDFGLSRTTLEPLAGIRISCKNDNYPTSYTVWRSDDGIVWDSQIVVTGQTNPGNQWNNVAIGSLMSDPLLSA